MPPSGAKKRALVVDASVARAANPQPTKPQAQACYQALDAIWRSSYVVVMPPVLKEEWRRHMSRYTERWLARMARRSRV